MPRAAAPLLAGFMGSVGGRVWAELGGAGPRVKRTQHIPGPGTPLGQGSVWGLSQTRRLEPDRRRIRRVVWSRGIINRPAQANPGQSPRSGGAGKGGRGLIKGRSLGPKEQARTAKVVWRQKQGFGARPAGQSLAQCWM